MFHEALVLVEPTKPVVRANVSVVTVLVHERWPRLEQSGDASYGDRPPPSRSNVRYFV
ncbi:MAG: hypothetical protein OXI46_03075 [Gemmatimonadota bacterium]|nr:hypothetical protein [Gemmatimonadota bacterium]